MRPLLLPKRTKVGGTLSRTTPPEDRHSSGSQGPSHPTSQPLKSPSTARGFYRGSPGFKGRGPHQMFTTNQQEEEKYRSVVARKDAAVNKRRPSPFDALDDFRCLRPYRKESRVERLSAKMEEESERQHISCVQQCVEHPAFDILFALVSWPSVWLKTTVSRSMCIVW